MAAFSDPEVMAALQDGSLFALPCFISFPLLVIFIFLFFPRFAICEVLFLFILFIFFTDERGLCLPSKHRNSFYLVLVSDACWVRVQQMPDSIMMQCTMGLL